MFNHNNKEWQWVDLKHLLDACTIYLPKGVADEKRPINS
jgi:hypothetical protein